MAENEKARVGIVGAGRMGLSMLKHLVNKGYSVTVCDISEKQREAARAAGAAIVKTPAEVGKASDLVILGVGYDDEVNDVVFGKDGVGVELSGAVERAFGDHALALAEQIRQYALIGDRDIAIAVGHVEADFQILAAGDTSGLDQAANADAGAGRDMFLRHVARRVEEHDRIAQRVEHERNRNGKHAERTADQDEASPLARHGWR